MSLCDSCFAKDKCNKYLRGDVVETAFCLKQFKLSSLYDEAFISNRQRNHLNLRIDSDGTDRDQFLYLTSIESNIDKFIADGENLYLYSTNCGNGKTSWALRLCQAYINKIWLRSSPDCKVLFINVPKFFLMLKDSISNQNEYIAHIKKNVANCDLVVWDDIGTKVGTEFEIENLLNIVNNRIDNGKSNIYTSNINPDQLRQRVGERLYSRIINMSKNVELRGLDKRGLL